MHEQELPPARRQWFSPFWCIAGGLLHFLLTYSVIDAWVMAEMVSRFGFAHSDATFWTGMMWFWNPLFMWKEVHEQVLGVFASFVLWSCVMAVLIGFVAPNFSRWFRRWIQKLATPRDPQRDSRLSSTFGAVSRFLALGAKRQFRICFATAVILVELVWFGVGFYTRYFGEERSFGIRDRVQFYPITRAIERTASFTLYEGLPHQFYESRELAKELETKETFRISDFAFYKRPLPVSEADIAALRDWASSAGSFSSYGGPKACGGYHPDYALVWKDGDRECALLVCFGCGEIFFTDRKRGLLGEFRMETYERVRAILTKYHDQRPQGKDGVAQQGESKD